MPAPVGNIKVLIYALSDPRNPKIPHYIGKTSQTLKRRMICHLCWAKKKHNHPLAIWISDILRDGFYPVIYELESCENAEISKTRETCWIQFFRPIGTLKNKSDGDGSKGLKGVVSPLNRAITTARNRLGWTPEMRAKIIPKQREKMKLRMVPVFCETNGKSYECLLDAEKDLKLASKTIRYSITNNVPVKGLLFRKTKNVSNSM